MIAYLITAAVIGLLVIAIYEVIEYLDNDR